MDHLNQISEPRRRNLSLILERSEYSSLHTPTNVRRQWCVIPDRHIAHGRSSRLRGRQAVRPVTHAGSNEGQCSCRLDYSRVMNSSVDDFRDNRNNLLKNEHFIAIDK